MAEPPQFVPVLPLDLLDYKARYLCRLRALGEHEMAWLIEEDLGRIAQEKPSK